MSSTLVYEPVIKQKNELLDDQLKFVLRKVISNPVDVVLDSHSIEYLRGLRDAGVSGAEEAIDAIIKHEQIRVYEEF